MKIINETVESRVLLKNIDHAVDKSDLDGIMDREYYLKVISQTFGVYMKKVLIELKDWDEGDFDINLAKKYCTNWFAEGLK